MCGWFGFSSGTKNELKKRVFVDVLVYRTILKQKYVMGIWIMVCLEGIPGYLGNPQLMYSENINIIILFPFEIFSFMLLYVNRGSSKQCDLSCVDCWVKWYK